MYMKQLDKLEGVISPRFLENARQRIIKYGIKGDAVLYPDKHGVPIRVGDTVKDSNGRVFEVDVISSTRDSVWVEDYDGKIRIPIDQVEVIKIV